MGRPAAQKRLKAAPALEHLYGKAIQVHGETVRLDASGHASTADKRVHDSLLSQGFWTPVEAK